MLEKIFPCLRKQTKTSLKNSWPNEKWQEYLYELVKTELKRTADDKQWAKSGLTPENWVALMAGMAKFESGFNPKLKYVEKFKNSKGDYVVSTGLFQISYESARGYGFPGITTEDLMDPFKNIQVAVAIMKKWTEIDGIVGNTKAPWRGGSRYWSVLRYKSDKIKEYMKPFTS